MMKTDKKKKEKRSQKKCCISAQAIEKGIINLDWVWHLLWFIIIWGPKSPPQTCVCNIAQRTRKVHLGHQILDLETVFGSFRQFGQNYGPYGMPANTEIQDKFQREFQESSKTRFWAISIVWCNTIELHFNCSFRGCPIWPCLLYADK